jgi:hypothetical protein
MTTTSLNIAGKVDPRTVEVLQLVERIANELGIPYVVIGATARDLVLHYYYGARIQRGTQDIDFAIQVADWSAFSTLTQALVIEGYEATKMAHRFKSPMLHNGSDLHKPLFTKIFHTKTVGYSGLNRPFDHQNGPCNARSLSKRVILGTQYLSIFSF